MNSPLYQALNEAKTAADALVQKLNLVSAETQKTKNLSELATIQELQRNARGTYLYLINEIRQLLPTLE